MAWFRRLAGIAALVGVLAAALSAAEERVPKKVEPLPGGLQLSSPVDQQIADQQLLHHARQMIRDGNFDGASALLESVYQRDPNNVVVLNLLRTCYDQLGQPGKSELFIRRMLETTPNSHILHVYLAESLLRQGDTTGARQEYEAAVRLVRDNHLGLYGQIIQSMQTIGLHDDALALIERFRTQLSDRTLYARNAGEILEARREYRRAAEEYYVAARDTARTGIEAENKLIMLLQFEGASEAVEKTLRAHTTDSTADAKAAQILADYYLRSGKMEEAMRFTLLRDSLGGTNGTALLHFMRTCSERKLYAEATRVGEEIVRRYGDSPLLSESRYLFADALIHLGRYEEAIAIYDTIIATYPRVQDKAEAAYRIGMVYLDYLDDPVSALKLFDSVSTVYTGGVGYLKAMLAAPDAYLRLGDLGRAREALAALHRRNMTEDATEEVAFKLAKIDFYDKRFDSSLAAFNKLLVDYPRGFFVNDALQLMLVIEEAGAEEPLLYDYANALLFAEQRRFDSSEAKLNLIAAPEGSALGDVALYRLAQMSLDQFDSSAALGYVARLSREYPDSYYMPFGLKLQGDMCIADPARLEQGKAIYRQLLENHANYPFTSEVRKKLRELEVDARTG